MGESSIGWLNPPPFARTAPFGSLAQPGYTFNAWIGCAKVDPECKHCYAEREAERGRIATFAEARRLHLPVWGAHAPRHFAAESTWKLPERWDRLADKAGYPRWCFGGSQMDWLEERDDLVASRARLVTLIEKTRNLRWVLLTKRPENFARLVPSWSRGVPSNVWIGISAGSQKSIDAKHDAFAAIPSTYKLISAEPLIGRTDFRKALRLPGMRWFLLGGENAAPAIAQPNSLEWMRDAMAQALEVPVIHRFVKQLGSRVFGTPSCRGCEREVFEGFVCEVCGDTVELVLVDQAGRPIRTEGDHAMRAGPGMRYERVLHLRHSKGEDWQEWPTDLQVQEWPDGAAFVRSEAA